MPQGTKAAPGYADGLVYSPCPLLSSPPLAPKIYFLGNSRIEIYGEALHVQRGRGRETPPKCTVS